ncbi:hypothetical protein TI04_02215 [Achromatium sp. WMS2]|nr:hypothetical protein TI04_02215 [Achromatium sp. WMS2]
MPTEDAKRIYGIDLGTTYSCIAYVDEYGKPVVVNNAEGNSTTPSVVYFEGPENIVVGQTAKDVAEVNSDQVVSTVKRVMGDANWIFEYNGHTYRPQHISSFILKKVVQDAQTNTGDVISEVVITCPAYFGVAEREATKQAGILAGLNVRYVIPEPTAAAICYGINQTQEQVILVFDLGGGTFDVTLIQVDSSNIRVICTGGDHRLGGRDWDEDIANWIAHQCINEHGGYIEDLTDNLATWQELINKAEKAKQALSNATKTIITQWHNGKRSAIELTRKTFEEITAHRLAQTLTLTEELMQIASQKGFIQIDKVILVGGSTYMPQVINAVQQRFPAIEVLQYDPNQAVAKGAALMGFQCQIDDKFRKMTEQLDSTQDQKEILGLPSPSRVKKIHNVTSKSFGIVVVDELDAECVVNLILADTEVSCSVTKQFGTSKPNQTGVELRCMENLERNENSAVSLEHATEIGKTELHFTKPLPKYSPVEITFSLSEDGLLTVRGKDLTTDQEVEASFTSKALLTAEELAEEVSHSKSLIIS